jgi:hypothetical protein
MNTMANLTLFIQDMEKRKLLRIVKEGPGDNPPPVTAT